MIKITIMDNQALIRDSLGYLLEQNSEFCVQKQLSCESLSLDEIKIIQPDVIIIDPQFRTNHGFEILNLLFKWATPPKVLVLAHHIDAVMTKKWLETGVSGIISKDCSIVEMVKAVKTVYSGDYYLCQEIAHSVALQGLLKTEAVPFLKLSYRESQVADMLLQGKNIQEISRILSISDKTANTYKYRLYKKLVVKNDVQLTRLAYKFNYLDASIF